MNELEVKELLEKCSFTRTGGSKEELRCAEMLKAEVAKRGYEARIEEFRVQMADIDECVLLADGKEVAVKAYRNSGSTPKEGLDAELYYLTSEDEDVIKEVKGKIVLVDGYLRKPVYESLVKNGALAFICYNGDPNYSDSDIDQRELRFSQYKDTKKIPGFQINVKDAITLVKNRAKHMHFVLTEKEYEVNSRNVILDIPGEIKETIVFSAHYDSVPLSYGSYDNLSGAVGIMGILDNLKGKTQHRSLRFVWCGSEERGLLGSKAYVRSHEKELADVRLNINIDMIGCIMGKVIACCTSEIDLVHYLNYLANEVGFPIKAYQDVYSSDSTPFADKGIPAISFARIARGNVHPIHCRYDNMSEMDMGHMVDDINFITDFASRMINAKYFPVKRVMPENMVAALDKYLGRK